MDLLKAWITNIILFILLATVVDLLLPNSTIKKYTKIVLGLLLITIILNPILKWVTVDYEKVLADFPQMNKSEELQINNSIEIKKKEIQASNRAYILKKMAVQLEKDVEEEMMDKFGLKIIEMRLEEDQKSQQAFPANVQKVIVRLVDHKQPDGKAVEAVSKIEINANKPPSSNQSEVQQNIATFLAEKWNVEKKAIEVLIEGGIKKTNGS